jgi:hypothetical protein
MLNLPNNGEATERSQNEQAADNMLREMAVDFLTNNDEIRKSPHWNWHLSLFLRRQTLSRLLYLNQIYQEIIEIPGYILEFGVQHGATLSSLASLRGVHEPFNHSRKIIGFDTFSGLSGSNKFNDGLLVQDGQYEVGLTWADTLQDILSIQENFSPISHIKKFEIVKGDVKQTLPEWLDKNPGAAVAMAIFDFDIYEPTRIAIELIKDRLLSNSIVVFDEFSCAHFPGETKAVMDSLGLNNLQLKRSPLQPYCAYGTLK